ncbi:MAG: DEAD/DEAH box helicase [Candidatus Lokiarchaeota archaeon]|nr:DEAD/DEAH box helicase [Candidatus Harpocratesius repetitus]
MNLQLTYLPAKYWNDPSSHFRLISKTKKPPQDSSFFIMWSTNELSKSSKLENDYSVLRNNLEKEIKWYFPKIPTAKLLECEIFLSIPYDNKLKSGEFQKVFQLRPIFGKIIPIPPAIKLLFFLQIIETNDRTKRIPQYSESIKTWAYLTKLTVELLSRGNFVPTLHEIDSNTFIGQWKTILKSQMDYQRFHLILRNSAWSAFNLPIDIIPPHGKIKEFQTSGLWHPSYLFIEYMDTVGDYLIRESLTDKFFAQFSAIYNYSPLEMENTCLEDPDTPWDLRFLHSCISKHRNFKITRFCDTPIPGILRNWVQNIQGFSFSHGLAFTFRLEYPKTEKSDWTLGFYLQPLHDPDYFIPLQELWGGILTHNAEFANVCDDENGLQEETLRALGTASKLFPPIKRALFGKGPSQVKLKAAEVMDFMRYSMYLLIQAGFNVVLPEEFTEKGQQRLSARLVIKPKSQSSQKRTHFASTNAQTALFDMDSMLEFHWEGMIEGNRLTEKEFLELANNREPLIFWRDRWILVDPEDMENLRPIFETQSKIKGEISYSEALKLGMVGDIQLSETSNHYEVVVEGEFRNIIDTLENIQEFSPIPIPSNFQGTLRPYQQSALTWLTHMTSLNFGVCLADDMGLGKTVEIISFLQRRKEDFPNAPGSILIICPTSVLFNWRREINRFAPDLEIYTHHGPNRVKNLQALQKFSQNHLLILTTYGTVRNDSEFLETIHFAGIILDESQNIKNYQAQKTKAILRLKSQFKIALSGTPIENRLLELWTLFSFLNPGLLGKRRIFQQKFILPIERYHDEQISAKLKRFISPFILRRLKTDTNIIQDLPEKNEIKIYLELSPKQAQLYAKVVRETLQEIENLEKSNIQRKGLILKLLTATKQICNHPVQYLYKTKHKVKILPKSAPINQSENPSNNLSEKQSDDIEISYSEFLHASQKLERLSEMVEEVLEDGEKLLIFTQFKQMGDLLKEFLELKYHLPVGWFHGGVPERQRQQLVDNFQSTALDSIPILILSLRAGGTGLNLTQASTVFHYDRWWNPAVEDQATDRAYRIGQKKTVNVYKFITTGTIEEKIDQMLEEKRDLADRILAAKDETWITALSNDELKELFSLSYS